MHDMIISNARLRMSIDERAKKKKDQKVQDFEYRKSINDKHALAFFFIGMSLNLNLDTSLLTAKVFQVENFANITLFLYFGTVIIVTILYMFLIPPEFYQLIASVWTLVASRICHFVLAIFANGKGGRNMFLLFYALNGLLRGVISLTSSHVISKHFLNESYLHLNNGGTFFSILVSLLQMACDAVIGTETVKQARYSLIIGQGFYLFETVIGTAWITVVFFIYGINPKQEQQQQQQQQQQSTSKFEISTKKFGYVKYYSSKSSIVIIASTLRVIFHPVLVPYMMDISYASKLIASIIFTTFEFFGRLFTFRIDERIDPYRKSDKISHSSYLTRQDIHIYLLFFYQMCVCLLAIYSCWFQKLQVSKNAVFICLITLTSGFVSGYTDNRGKEGAQAVMKYYSDLKLRSKNSGSSNNLPNITPDVPQDTSNVNDILILFDYISFLFGCMVSYMSQKAITDHKDTFEFIINSRREYLDIDSVRRLMQIMK